MKVLVFTSSYNRPHMLRQCILNAKNQTYKKFKHTINIVSNPDELHFYLPLLDDVYHNNMQIIHSINNHTHFNNMAAIKAVKGFDKYDLYIKMDDDDVYKSGYVENIVNKFQEDPTIDIVSSKIKYQLKQHTMYVSNKLYDNLGGNPKRTNYHMPMTFAFNNKAFQIIKDLSDKDITGFDDMTWRIHWNKHKLKHASVDNSQEIIWHIHGKNVSTASFIEK